MGMHTIGNTICIHIPSQIDNYSEIESFLVVLKWIFKMISYNKITLTYKLIALLLILALFFSISMFIQHFSHFKTHLNNLPDIKYNSKMQQFSIYFSKFDIFFFRSPILTKPDIQFFDHVRDSLSNIPALYHNVGEVLPIY